MEISFCALLRIKDTAGIFDSERARHIRRPAMPACFVNRQKPAPYLHLLKF